MSTAHWKPVSRPRGRDHHNTRSVRDDDQDDLENDFFSLCESETKDLDIREYYKSSRTRTSRGPKMFLVLLCAILGLGSYYGIEEETVLLKVKGEKDVLHSTSNSRVSVKTIDKSVLPKVQLLDSLGVFANLIDAKKSTDIPVFFHIPRSGGTTVKEIGALCYDLVQASEVGVELGDSGTTLNIMKDDRGAKYINVDTGTLHGLDKAIQLGLGSFHGVELISTPYIYNATRLFSKDQKGRIFLMMRHPIERAISTYYERASDPKTEAETGGLGIEEYAKSEYAENNWVTRFLSNSLSGELTPQHEAVAREFLKKKCLIGLLSEKGQSMERFQSYFGWSGESDKIDDCRERQLFLNWAGKNTHARVEAGSLTYSLFEDHNVFDLRLYEYAKELFEAQSYFFERKNSN